MCNPRRRTLGVGLVAVALLSSIPACGSGEDRNIVVVLRTGGGEDRVVTLEELGLTELTDELLGIYNKYEVMAEGVTDWDELTALYVKRAHELGDLVRSKRTARQMLDEGIVVGVYKGVLPKEDGPPQPPPGAIPVEIK